MEERKCSAVVNDKETGMEENKSAGNHNGVIVIESKNEEVEKERR